MKKFLNYKTGLFCGGAILGVAVITIVGCGQSNTAGLTTSLPGTTTASVNALNVAGAFQNCMEYGGTQVAESGSSLEACQIMMNFPLQTGVPVVVGQVNDTLSVNVSGTYGPNTSFGICDSGNISSVSQVLAVTTGSYTQATITVGTPTIITAPTQLTWEINSGVKIGCSRNAAAIAQITRCVDVNNNFYPCN